jgi:hypothetical protein
MNASDWLIIAATVFGPILAVQAQKWVERATESRRRRRWIFETILANRATRLADEHIKALNLIDLEFRTRVIPSKKDRAVVSAWQDLFGELTRGLKEGETDPVLVNAWVGRCNDFYVKLEATMAKALGFHFTDEELRRGIYYPRGHNEREQAQLTILHNLKRLLAGEAAINMRVIEFPGSPEAAAAQAALTEKMTRAYTKDGALKIVVSDEVAQTADAGFQQRLGEPRALGKRLPT